MESHYASRDTSPRGECRRHHIPRPLQCDTWYKGKDGFVGTDIWGAEAGHFTFLTPTIWLQQTEERMCLYVYQHKNLTIVLIVPHSSLANEQDIALMKQQLLDNVSCYYATDAYSFSYLCPQVLASNFLSYFIFTFMSTNITMNLY